MTTPSGWYHGEGDPPGTQRFWNGTEWVGEPVPQAAGGQPPPPSHPGPGLGPATSTSTLGRLFSNSGRVNRQTYALFLLGAFVLAVVLIAVDYAVGTVDEESGYGLFSVLGSLAMLWPGVTMAVKRLHDFGASGWWVLAVFIPLGGVVLLSLLVFAPGGTQGPNKHGSPRASGFGL